jgi:uncharacterized protein
MDSTTILPFTPHSFYQYLGQKKLMASRCTQCGALHLPPRAICPDCQASQMEWVQTSGIGKLAAFTSLTIGPTFMNEQGFGRDNPYLTGIVDLEEGVRISARILGFDAKDPASVQIGAPLQVEFLEVGEKIILGFISIK